MPLFLIPWLLNAKKFLSNPIVQYALVAVGILLILLCIYWKGERDGKAACEAAHTAAALAEEKRQVAVGEKVTATSVARTAEDKKVDVSNGDAVKRAIEKIRIVPMPMPVMKPDSNPMEKTTNESFADTVCIPSDVADELRSIH